MAALTNHAKDRAMERFGADDRGLCVIGSRLSDPAVYKVVDDPKADGEVRMVEYRGKALCGVIRDGVVTTILPRDNFSLARAKDTMTVRDVCDATGKSKQTVINAINRIFPGRVRHGVSTHLTEVEVAEISGELKRSHNSQSTLTVTTGLEVLENALRSMAELADLVRAERERANSAEATVEAQKPAVEFFHIVTDSKSAISMAEAAKVLDLRLNDKPVGRNTLFAFLRDENVLRFNNEPYQSYIDREWFRVIEQKYQTPDGETRINIKPMVFQKGLDGIRRLWNQRRAVA